MSSIKCNQFLSSFLVEVIQKCFEHIHKEICVISSHWSKHCYPVFLQMKSTTNTENATRIMIRFPVGSLKISVSEDKAKFLYFTRCLYLLTFLLKLLLSSYVNCNKFQKHERLFMIMEQQLPKC